MVIENIKRHLSYGEAKITAILTSIREVAGAITASTLTTVAVFLPIAFVGEPRRRTVPALRPDGHHRAAVLAAGLADDRSGPRLLVPARRPAGHAPGPRPPVKPLPRHRGQGPRGRAAQPPAARLPAGPDQDPEASGADPDRRRPGARRNRRHDPAAGHRPAGPLRREQHDGPARRCRPAPASPTPAPRRSRLEEVLRGIDGIKDVQVTSGNAAGRLLRADSPPAPPIPRSPW